MDPILQTLLTCFGALLVASVTVQLAFYRFQKEKRWERRVAAYERLIEALHQMKRAYGHDIRLEMLGKEPADPDEEELKRLGEARRELERAADLGGYLLSKEACTYLESYRKAIAKWHPTITWAEAITTGYDAAHQCLTQIIDIERRDLGFDRSRKSNRVGFFKLQLQRPRRR